jgi:hypothetical protein
VVLRNMFAFYQASISYADARLKEAQASKAQPTA